MNDTELSFQETLNLLLDENKKLSGEALALFSDMLPEQLKLLLDTWDEITLSRRQSFLALLKQALEDDLLLSYNALARALLSDEDAVIRTIAIRLLSDYDREDIIPTFLDIALHDPESEPRAETITTLGSYVLDGELEEISQQNLKKIEDVLIQIAQSDKKTELRQRAIESLGFSSRKEVRPLIKDAWERETVMWTASAVSAMGRSYDKGWEEEILEALLSENEIIRLAATKAAGELSLPSAHPILLKILTDDDDAAVLHAAIWSLSQVGGEEVREYLLSLLDQYDDDEFAQIEYIEDALSNLDFMEDAQSLDLFDFDSGDLPENH